MVSARNTPCVESREVQMGKPDHGDAFHAMWCCWAPITQDALTAAILSAFNQHTPRSDGARESDSKFLQGLCTGCCFFFCGCDGNAGGFPWKASLLRSSAPPLNIWMKSCSCIKGPVYQSAGCFSFFLLVPRRRFLLINHHRHHIVSISHRPRNLCHFVLMNNSWGCGLGSSASRLQPLSYMRRLKFCEFCVTHKTQIEMSVKFPKEQK